jgi:hypothetical protein
MRYSELIRGFLPYQPSTWPKENPNKDAFLDILERIFNETIINEIGNVISDAQAIHGNLGGRGHVVALSLFAAIDTLSSYMYSGEIEKCTTCKKGDTVGPTYRNYIEKYFDENYKPHALDLYRLYRNSLVHSWHLFQVNIMPGNEAIGERFGTLSIGLINFFEALKMSVSRYLEELHSNHELYSYAVNRYRNLIKFAS